MIAEWLGKVGNFTLTLAIVTAYGLFMGAFIDRTIAKVQGRIGIPYSQPVINILKNFVKRTAVSHGVMFYLGPVFRIAGGIGTLAFIPVIYGSETFANFSMAGDLFLVIYFMFFGQLGMALGAGESGHPYSAIGIARGLSQMTAYEVPFALAVISIVIQYDPLSITESGEKLLRFAEVGAALHALVYNKKAEKTANELRQTALYIAGLGRGEAHGKRMMVVGGEFRSPWNLLYDGHYLISDGPLNAVHPCYWDGNAEYYPHDPEKAGHLLEQREIRRVQLRAAVHGPAPGGARSP